MSWLLTDTEFNEAREAIRNGDATAELCMFVARLVSALGRSGSLAPALSPTGRWVEEDFEEIAHEWLVDGGLLEAGFLKAFDAVSSPRALSRYLERAFRNWLTSRSRRVAEPRLLIRSREIFNSSAEFERYRDANSWLDEWWGIADWDDPDPYQGSDDPLVAAAFALGELAILRHDADHADPVISNPDLQRLLRALLDAASSLITLRHVSAVLRRRFAFAYNEAPIELLDTDEGSISELGPEELLVSRETATEIIGELTGRQVNILHDRFNRGMKLEEIAKLHKVSRGTADNELKRASAIIREKALDDKNFNAIMEIVLEMAFQRDEGRDE